MSEVVMPRLSDSMEEGTILSWLKQVGEEVAVGEELVEIETDKANMAYEADVAGTLTEILAKEGETLPIGTPIARIGDGDGDSGKGRSAEAAGPFSATTPSPGGDGPASSPPAAEAKSADSEGPAAAAVAEAGERVKASPLARRLAKERGLDLSSLQGSGPGGRIVKADVEGAESEGAAPPAQAPPQVPGPAGQGASGATAKGEVEVQELTKLQQTIARRMAESKATAPHFYLQARIEMSACAKARQRLKETAKEGEVVPSVNDMVLKACAIALREQPKANGAYRDGRFELSSRVNIGVAVAAEGALIVPTVFDADQKGLRQIATEARALAAKVRAGKITPPELAGGTFTVSNLGMYGISNFGAVINVPQAAILAVGAIEEKPIVKDGEITTAQQMEVTLSCDHRILYGAEGAEFLARVKQLLEEPVALAL